MYHGTHYTLRKGRKVLTARGKQVCRENRQAGALAVASIALLTYSIWISSL